MFLATALLLGFMGSLHCAGMCGPIALSLPSSSRTYTAFFWERLLYNLGRTATYAALGAVFGLLGKSIWFAGFQQSLSLILGILVLLALTPYGLRTRNVPWAGLVDRVKTRLGQLMQQRGSWALLSFGLLNGLLPCGLVYTAAAGATATMNPASGALYMTVFGLGTIPMLMVIAWTGRTLPFAARLRWQKWIPVSMLLLGGLLIVRGLGLDIPYLSPALQGTSLACPHCRF